MNKNIFKIILMITILITLGLTILQFQKYTQTKNFNVINDRQSMIIEIPNGQYIEIIARNDSVYEGETFYKPFSTYSKLQKNSLLESTLNVNNSYIEEVNNETHYRKIDIKPVNTQLLNIEIETTTSYKYTPELNYSIQLDYSGTTNYTDNENNITFQDNGCTIQIEKTGGYQYIDYGNGKTLQISQKYQSQLNFSFNIYIDCNK